MNYQDNANMNLVLDDRGLVEADYFLCEAGTQGIATITEAVETAKAYTAWLCGDAGYEDFTETVSLSLTNNDGEEMDCVDIVKVKFTQKTFTWEIEKCK